MRIYAVVAYDYYLVSMKSGLEGRNNGEQVLPRRHRLRRVSMKSGLEGRNNLRRNM